MRGPVSNRWGRKLISDDSRVTDIPIDLEEAEEDRDGDRNEELTGAEKLAVVEPPLPPRLPEAA